MDRPFGWFIQGLYDLPFASQDHYKPGREFDGAIGTYYNFGVVGPLHGTCTDTVYSRQ